LANQKVQNTRDVCLPFPFNIFPANVFFVVQF
jgi:hypothetical protein